MSMNRPKRVSRKPSEKAAGRDRAQSSAAKPPKWKDAVASHPDGDFAPYASSATFAAQALIAHPKFGKGIVLEVDGNKIHILFEEGIRKLLHSS